MIRASIMCPSLCRTGLSGAIIPADSAQPHMKETISSIQTKLDHLYNRTQVNSIGHITNLSAEVKVGEISFVFIQIFACSGPRPDSSQHQQPPGERREQRSGWRVQGWREPAEHSETGDSDGAGEKGVSVLFRLPGKSQCAALRNSC